MASFFGAFVTVGIPIALTAYLLIGWLIHSGRLQRFGSSKELDDHLKSIKNDKKAKKKRKEKDAEPNYALKKWLSFGGGFFGTAALYTYLYIEVGEVVEFTLKMLNPDNWTFSITIDLFVNFIINSITNLVKAFTWFIYWGDDSTGLRIGFNFLFAYLGYRYGARLASDHAVEAYGHPQLWAWLERQKREWRAEKSASDSPTEEV